MESIERLANLGTPFSMTWVNKDTPPQYPVNCDVIDAWEYSQNTPRCPEEIVVKIKGFKNDIEGLWENLPAKN